MINHSLTVARGCDFTQLTLHRNIIRRNTPEKFERLIYNLRKFIYSPLSILSRLLLFVENCLFNIHSQLNFCSLFKK